MANPFADLIPAKPAERPAAAPAVAPAAAAANPFADLVPKAATPAPAAVDPMALGEVVPMPENRSGPTSRAGPRRPQPVVPAAPEELPILEAFLERAKAGLADTVGGTVQAVAEKLQAPFAALEGTALGELVAPAAAVYDPVIAAGQEASALAAGQRAAGSVGAINPQSVDELASMAMADPEGALRFLGGIGAESAPAMLIALATRNPRAAERVMGLTTFGTTYGQQRAAGADIGQAEQQAIASALIEAASSRAPAEAVLGGLPLGRRLVQAPLLEGAGEATAGGTQSLASDIIAGRPVDDERAILESAVGFASGAPMGLGEAVLGRGPQRAPDPAAPPSAPVVRIGPDGVLDIGTVTGTPEPDPLQLGNLAADVQPQAAPAAPPAPAETLEALLADPEFAATLDALAGGQAPAPAAASAPAAPSGAGGSVSPAGAVSSAPRRAAPEAIDAALAMDEDAYIAAVNPSGKRSSAEDEIAFAAGDIEAPADAVPAPDLSFTDKRGRPVQVVEAPDGTLYAQVDGKTVGLVESSNGETLNQVAKEYQGAGIGSGLIRAQLLRDPMTPAGSFSEAGEAARRSAFRQLRAERAPAPAALGDMVPAPATARAETRAAAASPTPRTPESAQPSTSEFTPGGKLFQAGKNTQALQLPDGTWRTRIRSKGQWQPWVSRETFDASPAFGYRPTTPPGGYVDVDGKRIRLAPKDAPRPKAPAGPKKPRNLLDVLARGRGLDREAFAAEGVDPKMLATQAGFGYVFRKEGGMTPDELREMMVEEGYLPPDSPDRPSESDVAQALDLLFEALSGEDVFAADQGDDVAAWMDAQRAEAEAWREETEAVLADLDDPIPAEDMDEALAYAALAAEREFAQQEARRGADEEAQGRNRPAGEGRTDRAAPESRGTEAAESRGVRRKERPPLEQLDGGPRRSQLDQDREFDETLEGARRNVRQLQAAVSPAARAIREALGTASRHVTVLNSPADLDPEVAARVDFGDRTEGFFDPVTGRAYVFADAVVTPERAVWVAMHETAGHLGLRGMALQQQRGDRAAASRQLVAALDRAASNPTVEALADQIARENPDYVPARAAEEALSELSAAVRTGDYAGIARRYGVTVPPGQRAGLRGDITRLVQAIRAFLQSLVGGQARFTDAEVYRLLGDAWRYAQTAPVGEAGVRGSLERAPEQPAFHGTPHTVDKFSLQKIGTGEGNQAFGWGLYFASKRGVAEYYRGMLGRPTERTKELRPEAIAAIRRADLLGFDTISEALEAVRAHGDFAKRWELESPEDVATVTAYRNSFGNIYKVEIPEDYELLDWEKPLSQQSPGVRLAIEEIMASDAMDADTREQLQRQLDGKVGLTGSQFYRTASSSFNLEFQPGESPQQTLSEMLRDHGVPGLRYADRNSRGSVTDKDYNYVIWDEGRIGEPTALESRRAFSDGRGQRRIEHNGAVFVKRGDDYLLAVDGQPADFFMVREAEAEADRVGGEVVQDDPIDGQRRTWSVRLPDRVRRDAEREFVPESRRSEATVFGMTRDEFVGKPRITTNANAVDLKPKALTSVATAPSVPFASRVGDYTARYSKDGAAVYDGDQVIASYNFGDTLVVSKGYRRSGIGSELVYQWRKRYPAPAVATARTNASQKIQERVWDRLRADSLRGALESRRPDDLFGAPTQAERIDAERRRRDAERDGRTGTGRTDMASGAGDLFAGRRPAQQRIDEPVDQTQTPAFRRWFGDSKVVDENGEPLVVYHGTNQPFDRFDKEMLGEHTKAVSATAFFFTDNREEASGYADLAAKRMIPGQRDHNDRVADLYRRVTAAERRRDWDEAERLTIEAEELEFGAINADPSGAQTIPVYLSLKNPMRVAVGGIASTGRVSDWIDEARANGNDGLILEEIEDGPMMGGPPTTHYVAFKPNQIKSATGNRGTFDPSSDSILESRRPRTPDVRRLETEPAPPNVGVIRKELDALRKDVRAFFTKSDLPKNPQNSLERINGVRALAFDAMMSRARVLKAKYPNSRGLQALMDTVFTEPGSGRPIYQTLTEGIQQRYSQFSNRWANALAQNGLVNMTKAENEKLRNALLGVGAPPPAYIKKAADQLRVLMDNQATDARTAGLDFGEVTDIGYLTRIYDEARIAENAQSEAAFLADAQTLFADHEFPAEVGQPRGMVYDRERLIRFVQIASQLNDPVVKAALDSMRQSLQSYRRTSDLADIRAVEAEVAGVYRRVATGYGAQRAAAWLHGIKTPNMADGFATVQSPGAPMLKERVLGPAADTVMAKWMVTDVQEILDTYGRAMSRKIEFSQRFGPTGNRVQEYLDQMTREGVATHDSALAAQMAATVAGTMKIPAPTELNAAASWVHAVGYVAMLDKAVISSVAEPVAAAMRTGDARLALGPLVQVVRAVRKKIGKPTKRGQEVEALAKAIGIVVNNGAEAVLMNQLGGDYALSPKPANLLSGFFRVTLLTALTQSQRIFSTGSADAYLRSLARSVTGTAQGMGDAVFGWSPAQARAELAELGITDADDFSAWLLAQGGTPDTWSLFDPSGRPTPQGQFYMAAVQRFVDQVIQNPNAGMRPQLAAAGPAGRLIYGVTAFSYSFYENLLKGGVKRIETIAKRDGWTKATQQAFVRFAVPAIALAVAQTAVSTLRELLLNPDRWEDMEDDERRRKLVELGLTRSFGLGGLDPIVQYLTGIKYGKSAAETAVGAAPGFFMQSLDGVTGLGSDRNSPNTSTTEFRAAQAVYSGLLQPTMNALLVKAGGGQSSVLRAMASAGIIVGGDKGRDEFAAMFGVTPERETELDRKFTEAGKELKALEAELKGRVSRLPKDQWEDEFDKLRQEYPQLLAGSELMVYANNAQNRRLGRAGVPMTDENGGLRIRRTKSDATTPRDIKDMGEQISDLNTIISTLREDRDISLQELTELNNQSATTAFGEMGIDQQRDLSRPATIRQRQAIIDELEEFRRELKRESLEMSKGADQ